MKYYWNITEILLKYFVFRLAKHIYYPSGVTVTAEKPLIYDKIDNLGLGGPGAPGGLGASGLQTTYQTTALSTFRPETASSSLDSSCSALLCSHSQTHHQGEKHCSSMQVTSPAQISALHLGDITRPQMAGICCKNRNINLTNEWEGKFIYFFI